ncbi:MAG: terminase small subunit [Oscillospiraceae bacterium]|nr:terminase small subunit [Oscillospiraceae bacterium]
MPKCKRQLSEKQQLFVSEYLVDLNATQAAIRAGYSAKTAAEAGYKLVHKGLTAAEIARAQADRSRRTGITADRVLRELARVAFCNPDDVIDFSTAEVKADATEDNLRCIAGVKLKSMYGDTGTMTEREIKLCDKLKALDMLAKHLGMYDKDTGTGEPGQTGVIMLPDVPPIEAPTDVEPPEVTDDA